MLDEWCRKIPLARHATDVEKHVEHKYFFHVGEILG
jgi:hypothetical protein